MIYADKLFGDYSILENILLDTVIPRFAKVRQHFSSSYIEDVYQETLNQLISSDYKLMLKPGMRICITASSRGIDRQKEILKAIVDYVKSCGCSPFVIPAMGSHGGATAEGQLAILEEYGITEEYLCCPILSSMETIRLGFAEEADKKHEIRIDRNAAEADGIIVFNRIKPHSAFRGPYESGLMKMMGIGMGKQEGAESLHKDGFGTFKTRIFLYGEYVRTHSNILFGVSTIENAYDKCNRIDVIKSKDIPEREKVLLEYAKTQIPSLPVSEADVLVVLEIGKNYSGSGMDPNITGTWATPYGGGGLNKQRVAVLDVSEQSKGNALGIGNADVIPLRLFNKIDFMQMYPNVLTNTVFKTIKVPMVLKNDEMCIKAVIKTCNEIDKDNPRVVIIKNSMDIEDIWLSEAFMSDSDLLKRVTVIEGLSYLRFDNNRNFLP